jgi:dihydrolipoamide dehydrogenase
MSEKNYDLIVIGAGPGGEVGAIRAAQLGLKVAMVEKNVHLGGTCLNVGCIPTKCLLESAKIWTKLNHVEKLGFKIGNPQYDWSAILERKNSIVNAQRKGLLFLMKKNGITVHQGLGRLIDGRTVEVSSGSQKETLKTRFILLATGSRVKELPFVKSNGQTILTSDSILDIDHVPKSLAVVGGGVVGMEFASLFASFGTEVTVIEMLPQVLPMEDPECVNELVKSLRKRNVKVETGAKLTGIDDKKDHCMVHVEGVESRRFDRVLLSIGRAPVSEDLGLANARIVNEKGFIKVDSHYKTSCDSVFAIGDVIGTAALAHTASAEAVHAVEIMAAHTPPLIDYQNNPSAIYTQPEIASIGMTEPVLKEKGIEYKVAKFPFAPLAKAKIEESTEGFIKILYEPRHKEILGVHILGAKATELIGEFVVGKMLEATVDEFAHAIHPHPTLSETIMEAAHVAIGGAIHL